MIADTLPVACRLWADIARLAYPVGGSPEIVIRADPRSPLPVEFYTDRERVYVCLHRPQEVESAWRNLVLPAYRPAPDLLYPGTGTMPDDELARNLWLDTLLFVLFHELYHPLVCPNSAADEKAIAHALYRGIRSRIPTLTSVDALEGAHHVKNLVWDLVVNVTFLARLGGAGLDPLRASCARGFAHARRRAGAAPVRSLPTAVVPAMYFLSARNATTDLLIGVMGALYTYLSAPAADLRERLLDAFRAEGRRLHCPVPPDELAVSLLEQFAGAEARLLLSGDRDVLRLARRAVLGGLLGLFEHPRKRYQAVEAVGRFLAPFLRGRQKQGSIDARTCGHRSAGQPPGDGDLAETLQDLMEELPAQDADDLIRGASRPGSGGGGDGEGGTGWAPLTVAAADEFYKRNSTPLSFRSPDSRTVWFDLGKQKQWRVKRAQTLTAPEAARLDMERVLTFQAATGLPLLMKLSEGYYQLNEYVLRQTPIRTYTRQACGLEVPDNWVLLVDSSGSMGSSAYVGTGEKYDVLMRVCYGVARGLVEAARLLRREVRFGVVNFSSATTFSGMCDLATAFAESLNPMKQTLLVPQCGGTTLDVGILAQVEAALAPGRTVYTLITDGEIDNGAEVAEYLGAWSVRADRSLLFVEVGAAPAVGGQLRQLAAVRPSVACFNVERVEEIGPVLGSVLVRYA